MPHQLVDNSLAAWTGAERRGYVVFGTAAYLDKKKKAAWLPVLAVLSIGVFVISILLRASSLLRTWRREPSMDSV
ncbi:hypothetical protein E2C01_047474 [Portunus trituberculatus]|uniref:Uncharacterized protein n=1 Tax=Portunus trituberculatus TaxID=210409 RepID=A0A5B7G8Y7_PORTR|nr:hypothetical protein [Portunus trituberculatus]